LPELCVEPSNLVIDLENRRLTLSGEAVRLTPNEYKILAVLAKHSGNVVTQNHIITEGCGSVKPG